MNGLGGRFLGVLERGLYIAVTCAAALLSLPYWLLHGLREGGGSLERYGWVPAAARRAADPAGCLWFHAASVGEVSVLARVVAPLADLTPTLPVVVTTVTATGRNRARQLLGERAHILYLPLDVPLIVRQVVKQLRPQVLVVAETELWPGLFRAVTRHGTPIVLVNGRLSQRTFGRYRLLQHGLAPILGAVAAVCVKSAEDGERYRQLGVPARVIVEAGDLKYEPLPGVASAGPSARRARMALPADRPIVVAGSTRDGEEVVVLQAFERLLEIHPGALLVLAPRYPARAEEIALLAAGTGLPLIRRTEQEEVIGANVRILLVDTIGELEGLYAASDAAFVGGSLVPVGGHNLLEPAGYGVPVLFGPYTGETGGADDLLLEAGAGIRVLDGEGLMRAWADLLDDPEHRQAMGSAGREAVARSRGALQRVVDAYRRALGLAPRGSRSGHPDGGSRSIRAEDVIAPPGEGFA